jgi:low temperature requirement protein LtrA
MGAFLVMAMATPEAFGKDALAFGLAYLVVNLVHAALFSRAPNESSKAIWRIAPINVSVALLIVGASFLPEEWAWTLWVLAIAALLVLPLKTASGFVMEPRHFVERHGLVLLIALGESVVSIGLGALGRPISAELLLAALLTLALIAALWWAYFDSDERRAEHALVQAQGEKKTRMGLLAFGYAELVMIGGFVSAAAGIKLVIEHLDEALPTAAAVLLAAGVGVYLLGSVLFRRFCGLRAGVPRFVAGVLCAASVPLGLTAGGLSQIGALLALLTVMLVIEHSGERPRP